MLSDYYVKMDQIEEYNKNEYDLENKDNPPDLNFYPLDEISLINWLNERINMTAINIENYNLKTLPDLSGFKNLINLNCSFNKLEYLPENLPDSLEFINCQMNNLKELPKKLPKSLKILKCSYNFITKLPDNLPKSLTVLICVKNQLKELPIHFPHSIEQVNFKKNTYLYKDYPNLSFLSNKQQLLYIININEAKIKKEIMQQLDLKNHLLSMWCEKTYHPDVIFS